jgi:hypothetical protein
LTRPQSRELRKRIVSHPVWSARPSREWEDPAGTSNKTTILQACLCEVAPAETVRLPDAPSLGTITVDGAVLRDAPSAAASEVGKADRGGKFELLGRSEDSLWLLGASGPSGLFWAEASDAETTVPVELLPDTAPVIAAQPGIAGLPQGIAPAEVAAWRQAIRFDAMIEFECRPIEKSKELIGEIVVEEEISIGDLIAGLERTRITDSGGKAIQG